MMTPKSVKPCVVASSNGNRSKDAHGVTCVAKAFKMMTDGADVLDALVAGVAIVELDPNQTGVGWSGLPNAEGVVQLDACCMHGPKKRAGGVAGIEGVRTPARVAQMVADETDHHLLVGKGAQEFARAMGIKIEEGLINENGAQAVARMEAPHGSAALPRSRKATRQAWHDAGLQMVREGLIDGEHYWGTINCDGVNAKGEVCGVTTTSGLAWKIPGPRRRLADPRRRPLRRRRRRRRRLDRPRRGEPLQPLVVPDRRRDAPRRASEGRRASRR